MRGNVNLKNFVEGMKAVIPAKNDTMYKRVLAIGDVHGKFTKLMSLWKKLSVTDDDLVIFLGDYVDRGNEVAEVLEWIMEQSQKPNIIVLSGNHERILTNVFHGCTDRILWILNGGKATICGLHKIKSKDTVLFNEILNFVEELPLYHSMTIGGKQFIFVHAGIDSRVPLEKQSEETLLWGRDFDYDGEAILVNGHSPVQAFSEFGVEDNPRPVFLNGNRLFMDTGSFLLDGKISAVDILSGQYWQSDAE